MERHMNISMGMIFVLVITLLLDGLGATIDRFLKEIFTQNSTCSSQAADL